MKSAAALAGGSDVTAVEARKFGDNLYHFDVSKAHADDGWDYYTDEWEVVDHDGNLPGIRTLQHPHLSRKAFYKESFRSENSRERQARNNPGS